VEITDIICTNNPNCVQYEVTLDCDIKFTVFFDIEKVDGSIAKEYVYSNIGSDETEAVFDFPHKGSRISAIEKIIKHIEGRLETNVNF